MKYKVFSMIGDSGWIADLKDYYHPSVDKEKTIPFGWHCKEFFSGIRCRR